MIKHTKRYYYRDELSLGFRGDKVQFEHKPYHQRSPEARAAYDRLRESLMAVGMRHPLITYQGHVLIGMRRFEIMCELAGERNKTFSCLEILEDVSAWTRDDIDRLDAFKLEMFGVNEFIG